RPARRGLLTLPLHDALPIWRPVGDDEQRVGLALDAMGRRLPSMRWADVYVPHVSPASMSPASMRRCPRSAPAPSAPARDAMGRRLRCWPTVLPSGIVALTGRLTHGPRSPAARRASACWPTVLPSGIVALRGIWLRWLSLSPVGGDEQRVGLAPHSPPPRRPALWPATRL